MIEITREKFMELEQSKFFAEFFNRYKKYPFNKTGKRYWLTEDTECKEAIEGKPISWRSDY